MKWIGLTGGIATGKSSAAAYLRSQGIAVADADAIVHQFLAQPNPIVDEIAQAFGPGVLLPAGGVDRKALGSMVFLDRKKLETLESIIHPHVKRHTRDLRQEWEQKSLPLAIYDVPLLFEKNMQNDFDGIVCISSRLDLQRARLKQRNHWTDEEIEHRLRAQLPMAMKEKRATWVISNNGVLEDLYKQLDVVLQKIKASV